MSAYSAPPTGTVTFLFTDIEGSTRLWEKFPDAMRPALARHDALLRVSIEDHGGFVFRTLGDAFCAAFATAPDAFRAALAAQLALTAELWPEHVRLGVRMALHTGAAAERGGDYSGQTLNHVFSLLTAGHGEQTLLSAMAQELVCDSLPEGASLRDLGAASPPGWTRAEHVFQLQHPALPTDFPPLRVQNDAAKRNNLPQQVTSFVGREKEIAEVKGLLAQTRLLTLTGVGGSGKTRLSLQVVADLQDHYFDGAWLVELAALSDPILVPQAVATVLNVREEAGKSIPQALTAALKTKRLLLILDNCEHLVAACAALADELLRSCPGVHLLASSREPLGVGGEQTYRVPSLTLPDPAQTQTVESLSQYEAVRLFVERAQAVQPLFAVDTANAPAVAQICFHLDGIPLALELAAARVRSLTVEEVNTRLDNRFRLLTGGSRTALPRQQTLRALIDWSYDLLTETEKTLLRRLSVFAGGWPLPAAEAVGAGTGIEDWEVLDLLTSLVDKSLVVYETGTGGVDRFRLLETVRSYALDRLGESGEAATVQERAAAWFLHFAETAEPQGRGPEQAVWLRRLDTEHDNLRASLTWYEQQAEGVAAGLQLAASLGLFWAVRGYYSEGRRRLARALERTTETSGWEDSPVWAKALHEAGVLAYDQGDLTAAQTYFERSLAGKRRRGDQKGIAGSLQSLGTVAYNRGDYPAARALLEESLALQRQWEDWSGAAHSLNNLGGVAYNQGEYAAARALFEESLQLRRQLEDTRGIAASLVSLGSLVIRQGDYSYARSLQEEGLTLARQVGDQRGIANSLVSLGDVAARQGDYAEAQGLYEESLSLARRLGHQEGIAYSLEGLAGVARRRGDSPAAHVLYKESLALYRQMADSEGIAYSLEGLAGAAQDQDQPVRAARLWTAAAALREQIGSHLSPTDQEEIGRKAALLREALGAAAFTATWDAGRAMTVEEAVEYALAAE